MKNILLFLRKHLFAEIVIIAVVFRLIVAPLALNGDLLTQAEWGNWMYTHGTKGLYDWNKWLNEWPNHPPLMSLVYLWIYKLHSSLMWLFSSVGTFIALNRLAPTKFIWLFDFTRWFGSAFYLNTFFLKGIVLTTKLIMILADVAIALIIFFLCKQNKIDWKRYALAYLFLPFSWYLSALWGQSDQLAFVLLISAFILLVGRWAVLAPVLLAVAVNLKPTGLILVPLFVGIWFKQKQSLVKLIIGGAGAVVMTLYITSLFTDKSPWEFLCNDLWRRLFLIKPPFTTVSAFNFWYIFHAKDLVAETTKYIGIAAKLWGYAAFGLITIFSVAIVKFKKMDSVFAAVFAAGFGGWLVMTNMYERYLFAGLVALLFLAIYKPQYFKYFVILSFIYLANMFNGWWYPESFKIGKELFLWNDRLVTRLLSTANLVIYLKLIWMIKKEYRNGKKGSNLLK